MRSFFSKPRSRTGSKTALGDVLPANAQWRLGSDRLSHQGTVFCIAFSPDGKTLASGGGYGDATIRLWNPTTGTEILRIKDGGVVRDLVWSADGKLLLTASDGDGVRWWDASTGKLIRPLPKNTGSPVHLALSSDGKTLAVGETDFTGSSDHDHGVRLRDAHTGKELHHFKAARAYNVVFSPDGQTVALGGEQKKIRLWDVGTGKEHPILKGHKGGTYAVAFSPNGKLLASGGSYGEPATYLWEWPSRRLVHRLGTHQYGVGAIRFAPDGKTLATGSGSPNGIIQLWDVGTGKEICKLKGHHSPIHGLSFSADGKTLASIGSWERTIRLWSIADAKECSLFARHQGEVSTVAFAPDSQIVATASYDQTVALWKTSTGEKVGELLGHQGKVNAVTFSPNGKLLASGGDDKTIRLWQASTNKELRQFRGPLDEFTGTELLKFQGPLHEITCLAFSPDGRTLASGEGKWGGVFVSGMRMPDRSVRLWDVTTGKPIHEFQAKIGRVDSIAFAPDGRILASAGPDGAMVHLWDPMTGKRLGKLESEPEPAMPRTMAEGITRVVFSPDGRTLASVSHYRFPSNFRATDDKKTREVRMVRLWEVVSRKERFQIRVPFRWLKDGFIERERGNEIASVAFSADGESLILGKENGAVTVWNLLTAKETKVIPAHKDKVAAIAISLDGKTFATGSEDMTALLWDATNVLRSQRPKPTGLTLKERESLWINLAAADGSIAYRAMWTLVCEPRDCLALLQQRLKPVPKLDAASVAQLIGTLDNDKFTVREQAMTELNLLGEVVLPALRKAITAQTSVEARNRIEKLIEKFGAPVPPPEALRALRAVEILERIGTAEARQMLQAISQGASEARLSQDAKASIERIGRLEPPSP